MAQYPTLLSPIQVGPLQLPNRVVMGSMHTGLEDWPWQINKLAAFYQERAAANVGLIITGGFSPNFTGSLYPFASNVAFPWSLTGHRKITNAVHQAGGKIALQLLHAGRYAAHPFATAPSAIKAPINKFTPKALSTKATQKIIADFAKAAQRAKAAGYDGVEIMGSEGYLLNQFLATRTNQREDKFGGSFENRARLPIDVVKTVREKCGDDFAVIYRQSMLDLVENGLTQDEVIQLAKWIEQAGADTINTGIGWHEARVPTIVTSVPRAAFIDYTEAVKKVVSIPVIASNRINVPEVAEDILSKDKADLISMARPLLADAQWVSKATQPELGPINVCIACNQACLDHVFKGQAASCMINPRAGKESLIHFDPSPRPKKVDVVGAGPAGLSAAVEAAERGHKVRLFEVSDRIGGQFNYAATIPGKEEFKETLNYYSKQIERLNVELLLNTSYESQQAEHVDHVLVATGVKPRKLPFESSDTVQVIPYDTLLKGEKTAGKNIAIIGAGGIGFDVASYLINSSSSTDVQAWEAQWGVDPDSPGGLAKAAAGTMPQETIYLLQRKTTRHGKTLGLTSGWVHRKHIQHAGVTMLGGVEYLAVTDSGLKIRHEGEEKILAVDTVIICAGQVSVNALAGDLAAKEIPHTIIGGAKLAAELDAKRAIRDGLEAVLALG